MIGMWDNSGVGFAGLPACWQLGDNPGTVSSGFFPMYSPADNVTAEFTQGSFVYENGVLKKTTESLSHIATNYYLTFGPSFAMTLCAWVLRKTVVNHETFYALVDEDANRSFSFRVPSNTDRSVFQITQGGNLNLMGTGQGDVSDELVFVAMAIQGNGSGAVYVNGEFIVGAPKLFQGMSDYQSTVPLHVGGGDYDYSEAMVDMHGLILYTRYLGSGEIGTLAYLGPDLGGLRGYDNGDGTMRLMSPGDGAIAVGVGIGLGL